MGCLPRHCFGSAAGVFTPSLFCECCWGVYPATVVGVLLWECCCGGTAGVFTSPLLCAGAIGGVNDRGSRYIDSALFLMWIRRFVSMAGCTKHSPHILLVVGDESHKTLEVIDFAKEHGIILITFPPHCNHRLHPLDRTFFKSLTASYSRVWKKWLVSHRERAISQFEVVSLFREAYNAISTVQSAVNGFLASGTWPFKDTTFDHEFALLEAAAPNHDQLTAAADQPGAAVIDP